MVFIQSLDLGRSSKGKRREEKERKGKDYRCIRNTLRELKLELRRWQSAMRISNDGKLECSRRSYGHFKVR
jgi:5-bromo-4-chloroindolyl phosphate hydrolysis protein